MLTKIKKIFKSESKTYIKWKRNLYVSPSIGFVVAILFFFAFPPSPLAQSILILILTTGIAFLVQIQIDMQGFFHDVVDYNPIIMALPDISKKIKEIPELTTKNGSVDFALDSLKKMSDEGFIQVNVPMKDYIKYLIALVKNTRQYIYGTNIFRPRTIIESIDAKTPGITEYLKIMRESKCKQKIRINILSTNDIKEIIQDAVMSLTTKPEGKEPECCKDEFIPEIVWYLKEINGWQTQNIRKIDLLWTTHELAIDNITLNNLPLSETSKHEIDDYAIFDQQVLFLYDYNETTYKGTMLLQWDLIPTTSKVGKYLVPFSNIADDLQNNEIDRNTHLFLSFSELINNIKWGNNHFEINNTELEIISQLKDLDQIAVYKKMEQRVRNGEWKFKKDHFGYYFLKTL